MCREINLLMELAIPSRVDVDGIEKTKEFAMTDESEQVTSNRDEAAGYLAYETPADILRDDTLDKKRKKSLLESWKMDLNSRLYAESEGMSKSEPISAGKEAGLAEKEQLVNQALEMLSNKQQ
tara:strand:- start:1410 stop:1778 length:369 start_codon:yes stop_codon:yes gene_type:complete